MRKIEKLLLSLIVNGFCFHLVIAQTECVPAQLGNTIPDISIGTDFFTGKPISLISEIQERLIIIDFWHTGCAACIAGFPKLEKLQEEFGSAIQIFLVNSVQDSSQLARGLQNRKWKGNMLPNLPIVLASDELAGIFPHQSVPHHVWLDNQGKVLVMGSSMNTNARKIREALKGNEIYALKNSNLSAPVDEHFSLHGLNTPRVITNGGYPSFVFTGFLNDYSPTAAFHSTGVPVADTHFFRDTYLNHDVLALYHAVFSGVIREQSHNVIYAGKFSYGGTYWMDFVKLDRDLDTLVLTSNFVDKQLLTDRQYVDCRYSYEQIIPGTARDRQSTMFNNLNSYFGDKLGIQVRIIEIAVPCYVITNPAIGFVKDQVQSSTPLKRDLGYHLFKLSERKENSVDKLVIDETGLGESLGLSLPHYDARYDFKDIVRILEQAGLEVSIQERPLKFIQVDRAKMP